ncbi:hypothetical protein Q4E93_21455 [Flavitalea sp. BT771]|uniref:hypothetical protein n=1 Tax=Flavitalea sp. BT771 TaxID=3063329 RepID=UPI0026E298AC|nr:hypothetical protein [Flavitalea sp. BT771]MDO6433191.1 hypothetical protein [Flavitalea sp. BT771]MDV6221533.1 hypothetical protein [Flavitalea sp. BT771]
MYTHFLIGAGTHEMEGIPGMIAARYNIQQKINTLHYCNYNRIEVILTSNKQEDPSRMGVFRDDGKRAHLQYYADEKAFRRPDGSTDLPQLYKALLAGLEILWEKKGWNTEDLREIYRKIEEEGFFVSVAAGKALTSPDKQCKAEFYCVLYPGYADYYLWFYNKKKKWERKIMFLKGHEEPALFFNFFQNRDWRDNEYFLISDWNKEVFFVFNVNTDAFTVEYKPVHSLEMAQNKLKSFEAGLTQEERTKLFGLPY